MQKKPWSALVVVLSMSIALAGCGSDDTDTPSTTTDTATGTDASGSDGSGSDTEGTDTGGGGSDAAGDAATGPGNLAEVAAAAGTFKTLLAAAKAAGLDGALAGTGPYTVFAPTDDAFAKLPAGTVDELLKPENKAKLTAVLTYHVVEGKVESKDVKTGKVKTLSGLELDVVADAGGVTVNGAKVTAADIQASNGVIHVIDSVLLPPAPTPGSIVAEADKAGTFKTLLAAAKAAGLDGVLAGEGSFTVFAPTDDAFAKLAAGTVDELLKPENKAKLAAILSHHVVAAKVMAADVKAGVVASVNGTSLTIQVAGGKVMVDGANVTATDIAASNGVIHVIDAVILPPDLVQLAALQPNLKTLVQAVTAAGLVDTLKGAGPFTVFAPTDDAFGKVDAAALADLLKPENKDKLTSVLLFHVLGAKVMAADVKAGQVDTAGKQKLTITVDMGVVKVDAATVIATDIVATNGVVHLIDAVIFPAT